MFEFLLTLVPKRVLLARKGDGSFISSRITFGTKDERLSTHSQKKQPRKPIWHDNSHVMVTEHVNTLVPTYTPSINLLEKSNLHPFLPFVWSTFCNICTAAVSGHSFLSLRSSRCNKKVLVFCLSNSFLDSGTGFLYQNYDLIFFSFGIQDNSSHSNIHT